MSDFPMMDKCDEKAKTMPHFTLLAKDDFAIPLILRWMEIAEEAGTPDEKLDEAKRLLTAIQDWRTLNPTLCKIPD